MRERKKGEREIFLFFFFFVFSIRQESRMFVPSFSLPRSGGFTRMG